MWLGLKNRPVLAAVWVLSAFAVFSLTLLPVSAETSVVRADICDNAFTAPTITAPAEATQTEAANTIVSGTGEPAMTVSIRDNGTPVGATTVAGDGTFSVQIPLFVGGNSLVAREQDDCENIKDSPAINVERIKKATPPQEGGNNPQPSTPQGSAGSGNGTSRQSGSSPTTPPVDESPLNRDSGQEKPKEPTKGFPKPTITSLKPGQKLKSEKVWVGGKAAPGSMVTIYVNGKEVARVVADADGTYGAQVVLRKGKNTLQVFSELSGKSAWSDPLSVEYRPDEGAKIYNYPWILWIIIILIILLIMLIIWLAYRHKRRKDKEEIAY